MEASRNQADLSEPLPTGDAIADLERKIAYRTAGRIRGLRIEALGEAVILSGRTSTYYVKQLATQIALDENAEYALQNSIEVV